ncbi:MAG TPA: hypothetical protein VN791_06835 [Acidimicrobiales bacterium]|nr:hypothetical protein [Acidimicrobiales bacterium]
MSITTAVGSAVSGAVGDVVGGVANAGFAAVFTAAGQWVASGAVWLLGQVGHAMAASTAVDLSSGWFSEHESVMASMAAAVLLPMLVCAALQALYRQSASMLARAFLVQLPLALLLTGVVVELVQMALAVTDALSSQVLAGAGVDTTNILAPVSEFLAGAGAVNVQVPAFVVFVGGLLVAVAALGLWLELVVRAAAVSVAVLFLPLALATMVWPAVSHWCRRLADTLVALILSKLVIAAVLALAIGALAGGLGVGATGGDGGGFAAVISGIALLIIATLSPFTLLRLIPAVEAGAVTHLESARHRLSSPVRQGGNLALDMARARKRVDDGTGGAADPENVGSAGSTISMVAGSAHLAEYFHRVGAAGVDLSSVVSRETGADTAGGADDGAEAPGRDGTGAGGRG